MGTTDIPYSATNDCGEGELTHRIAGHLHSTLAYSPAKNGGFSVLGCDEADTCARSEASHDTDTKPSGNGWDCVSEGTVAPWDTWKDVGETDSDYEKSGNRTPPVTRTSIDDIIFLSPYWLLLAMKRVLTHHLEGDLKEIM